MHNYLIQAITWISFLAGWASMNAQINSSWIHLSNPKGVKSVSLIHVFIDSTGNDTSTEINTLYYSKLGEQDSIVKTYKGNYIFKQIWERDSINRYKRIDFNMDNNNISGIKEVTRDKRSNIIEEKRTHLYKEGKFTERKEYKYCQDSNVIVIIYRNDTIYSVSRNTFLNRAYPLQEDKIDIPKGIGIEEINCESIDTFRIMDTKKFDNKIIDNFIVTTSYMDSGDCIELQYLLVDGIDCRNHTQYDSNGNLLSHEFIYESRDTVFSVEREINENEDVKYYYFENFDKSIRYEYDYNKGIFINKSINRFQYEYDMNHNWIRREESNLIDNWSKIIIRKIDYY